MTVDLNTGVLVIGAGLSGLHTALNLINQGIDVLVVEGRNRTGGRIVSANYHSTEATGSKFDLGPSWFWPHQQRMLQLIKQLEMGGTVFEQYSAGAGVYEESSGSIHRGIPGISMAGSLRLSGGMGSLIDSLENGIPDSSLKKDCCIHDLHWSGGTFEASGRCRNTIATIRCKKVVIALPPRIAINTITFTPALPAARIGHLTSIPTWMASQGKAVMEYATPFWKQNGYAGDAFSQVGPLREIHDASSADESAHALFGFLDAGYLKRKIELQKQQQLIHEQLVRLFGPTGETPLQFKTIDWSGESLTSVERDCTEPAVHSLLQLEQPAEPEFAGALIWSGTEAANTQQHNNGYLEGALQASERTLNLLG